MAGKQKKSGQDEKVSKILHNWIYW